MPQVKSAMAIKNKLRFNFVCAVAVSKCAERVPGLDYLARENAIRPRL